MKSRWYYRHNQLLLIGLISFIVTFIYRFPDIYAYFTTPSGMVFLGQNSWFDPHDIDIYVSVIRYAQIGHLLLPNLWTAIPNEPIFIFPVELLFGYIFRFLPPFLLFWLSSIVCGIMLICSMFWLIRRTQLSYLLAGATTLAVSLGGGFGFLLYSRITSSDINSSIASFYEAFLKPHEAIAMVGYLFALVLFYEISSGTTKVDSRKTLLLILNLVIALLIYPYFIVSYLLITLLFIVVSKIKLQKLLLLCIFMPGCFTILFMTWQLWQNQGFYQPLMQYLPTPSLDTVLGLGILFPLFCFQLFFMKKTQFMNYLILWVLVTFALAFLPFGPGMIFLRGVLFPLILLVVLQTQVLIRHIPETSTRCVLWILFFCILCGTNVYIMFLRNYIAHTDQAVDVVYMHKEEYKIFAYLNAYTPQNSGVLAGERMSNLIPAYTHDRGCIGSMGSVTDIYTNQVSIVAAFYAGQAKDANYLKKNNISYVLWGPLEQDMTTRYARGNITDLRQLYKNLELVYETKTSKLYKVM